MSPPKLHNLPASPSRKGSLSPNWRERDSNSSYYPDAGSLTSVLNSSIDRMGTSMNASIDRMGNSISASILNMSAAVGKSLEKNNDNLNKQFDSLGSRMDLGFQSITQRLSDIQVISPERSCRISGNNYSFSARSSSQSPRWDQSHNRCFYCNEFGHFQAACPKRSPGRLNRSASSSQSPSRYQTSGGKKESNCWGLLTVANLQSHVLMAAQMWVILFAKIIYGGMNYLNLILLVHMQAVQMIYS